MQKPNAPCKDCADRQLGCHSICEKYIEYKVSNEEYKTHMNHLTRADKEGQDIAVRRAERVRNWYRKH